MNAGVFCTASQKDIKTLVWKLIEALLLTISALSRSDRSILGTLNELVQRNLD
jgi:hypothetical protein